MRAFVDPSIAPAKRRQLLATASGQPLTDGAHLAVSSIASLIPAEAIGKLAKLAQDANGKSSERLGATKWWGNAVPEDFVRTGTVFTDFIKAAKDPEFKKQIDRALSVVRVAGRLEAEYLSRIALTVPAGNLPRIRKALADYSAEILLASARAARVNSIGGKEGRAVAGLVDAILELGIAQLDADASVGRSLRIKKSLAKITARGLACAALPEKLAEGQMPEQKHWDGLKRRVDQVTKTLERELIAAVEMSSEAKGAVSNLLNDVRLSGRYLLAIAKIGGSLGNANIPPQERADLIKKSVEDLGPVFIKFVQTLANHSNDLLDLGAQAEGRKRSDENPIAIALRSLQDRVTPMSDAEVRAEVFRSLGKDIKDAFVGFDMVPVASASIGQVHRATIRVKDHRFSRGRLVEVAVKVQRPNLGQEFKDATRAIELSLGIVKESVSVFEEIPDKYRSLTRKFIGIAETTLSNVVRSFAGETDFVNEAKMTKAFARSVRSDPNTYVPEVYDTHCGSGVVTMQFVRGEKLSEHLARYKVATEAPAVSTHAVGNASPQSSAEDRARAFALKTYGLRPLLAKTSQINDEVRVRLKFDHPIFRTTTVTVNPDGSMAADGKIPGITTETVSRLRNSILASWVSQHAIKRQIHGDIHDGNFLILPDGRTVALLDFGQTLNPRPHHYGAPAAFLVAVGANALAQYTEPMPGRAARATRPLAQLVGRPSVLAKSLMKMTEEYPRLSKTERRAVAKKLGEALNAMLRADGESAEFGDDKAAQITRLLLDVGLTPSSLYAQWIKTNSSMYGNIGRFTRSGAPGFDRSSVSIVGGVLRDFLMPRPVTQTAHWLKQRRVNKLLSESAPDNE